MKFIRILFLLFLVSCADHDLQSDDCFDPTQVKSAACYEIYDPVCGCDGNTYSNDCFADAAGIKNWSAGKCPD